jgi:hypothetical protein
MENKTRALAEKLEPPAVECWHQLRFFAVGAFFKIARYDDAYDHARFCVTQSPHDFHILQLFNRIANK